MKRIDSANVALDLFGPGKHGFQGGNPAANLPATFFTPDWANHVQEELMNIVEAAGLAQDPANRAQVLQAISKLTSLPAGAEIDWGGTTAPPGFLKLNGSVPLVSSVPNLVANVYCGDANNATASYYYRCTDPLNPSTTRSTTGAYFALKNARGRFRRGLSDGDTIDAGRSAWSYQAHAQQDHTHTVPVSGGPGGSSQLVGTNGQAPATLNTGWVAGASVASENRPDNYPSLVCVKI